MGGPFPSLSHDPGIKIWIHLAIDKIDTIEIVFAALTTQHDRNQMTHEVTIPSSDKVDVVGLPDFVFRCTVTIRDGLI